MRDVMVIIVLALIGLGAYVYFSDDGYTSLKTGKQLTAGQVQPTDIGGAGFHLTNQFGEAVTERSFRNSKSLVFFGFTSCPDICPTTLAVMADAFDKLGSNVDEVRPIFITVDPEHDTPQVLQEYLLNYNKEIVGLTGPKEEIEKLEKSYKVYSNKSADGQFSHSDLIYLMDEKGKYMTHFNRENTADDIVAYVKKHR